MAYTISNTFTYCCGSPAGKYLTQKSDPLTLSLDFGLVIASGAIGVFLLSGGGTNVVPGIGLLAGGCVIALGDLIMGVIKWKEKAQANSIYLQIVSSPQYGKHGPPSGEEKNYCDKILNDLYLGNLIAFAEASYQEELRLPTQSGKMRLVDTSNPLNFDTIITACPFSQMAKTLRGASAICETDFSRKLDEMGVEWHRVGENVVDHESFWKDLVCGCTSASPPESLPEDVEKWFESTFLEMDKGVQGKKRVLVHCYAGISRSATIVAAYLINRYGVSTDEALNFLRNQRPCVDPRFTAQLREYEQKLKISRLQ